MGGVGPLVCPSCGETLCDGAAWRALRVVPGALPAYRLSHRRAGGGRCVTDRGPWLRELPSICTDGGAAATMVGSSRSARDDDLATAS